jgi:aldose 1-epimerase
MRDRAYSAEQLLDHGIPAIRLADADHGIEVSIVPSIGNRAWEMSVRGANILYFPFDSPAALKGNKSLNGVPFLAPWANRMPEGFHANGKHYSFNAGSDSIRLDQNGIPIHGLLTSSPFWEVTGTAADDASAHVTSRLEFWRHPDLMANWPFAHDYQMTYRLAGGVLEVKVTLRNLSSDPMPVALGFHPYFQLPGVRMEDSVAHIPVQRHVETDSRLVATGETTPVAFTGPVSLKDHKFDDGFTDLIRDANGRAVFSVEGGGKKIEVGFGPRYQVGVVYAPPGQNFICFEPMTAITNGVNLAYECKYPELQTVAPGAEWQESFWIHPQGF